MRRLLPIGPYRTPEVPALPASRLVPPPRRARRVARVLAVAFLAFLVAAAFAPWRQNVSGKGRVIAYTPLERQQTIEAPVNGRVVRFMVQEGSRVSAGDVIVEISDNDPLYLERLRSQRAAYEVSVDSYEGQAAAMEGRIDSVRASRDAQIASAEAQVRGARDRMRSAEQTLEAAEAALETAAINLGRLEALAGEGLSSRRELELAILDERRARTTRDSARAALDAARAEVESKQASLESTRATAIADVQSAEASYRSAVSQLASARATLASADVGVSRQESQLVTAPRDGTIFRLAAYAGGEQVKAGDALAVLVPDTEQRAVELVVDGNDAALVSPGAEVRLQFEGWPAVQFAGWPQVAVGTFGGKVAFVDATDDGNGDFRVVVVPDEGSEAWPSSRFLRQGVRTRGWLLLKEVRLGYELWRQFNGFPPAIDVPEGEPGYASPRSASASSSSSGTGGGK